jgi:short-subunit dehydrogenase
VISPLYRRVAYAASKHALEGFFKSLRIEEKAHGVDCLIAAPSFVATNIGNAQSQADGTARPGSAADGVDYMSPEDAAAEILRGFDRKRAFTPVGRIARMAYLLNRLSPALYERIIEKRIAR